ncbi:unnamed protein product [Peniophora sp. CBMAI 1063]|nr:unnamed protein product [Peniophora sp. CBMAI 1063]
MSAQSDSSEIFPNMIFSASASTSQLSWDEVSQVSVMDEDEEYDDCSRLLVPPPARSLSPGSDMMHGVLLPAHTPEAGFAHQRSQRMPVTDDNYVYILQSELRRNERSTVHSARVQALVSLDASVDSILSTSPERSSDMPKHVAVKIYPKFYEAFSRREVDNEIEILRRIQEHPSPFLCHMYSHFEDDEQVYIVTDLYRDALSDLAAEWVIDLSLDEIRSYGAQILQAIEDMRSLGIVHYRISPENIFSTSSGHLVLDDFSHAVWRAKTPQDCFTMSASEHSDGENLEGFDVDMHAYHLIFSNLLRTWSGQHCASSVVGSVSKCDASQGFEGNAVNPFEGVLRIPRMDIPSS